MSENVIYLTDQTPQGEVNEELVEMLGRLKERAECGEITGLAYCATDGVDMLNTGWDSGGHNLLLSSAIAILNSKYQSVFHEDDD